MTTYYFLICSQQIEEDSLRRGNRIYEHQYVRPTLYLLHHSRLVFSIKIRGLPSRLVDIALLESGARDSHVLCGSEVYQSEAIVACFLVHTVFPDCGAKKTFSAHFRVKIANQHFNICSGASVIQNLEFVVKGVLVSSLASVGAWAHMSLM